MDVVSRLIVVFVQLVLVKTKALHYGGLGFFEQVAHSSERRLLDLFHYHAEYRLAVAPILVFGYGTRALRDLIKYVIA